MSNAVKKFLLMSVATLPLLAHSNDVLAAELDPEDLLNLSLEQLTDIEVTSVSKRAEKANEAAAAVYVITQDDIRRSGARSIPEALRGAPGVNVAQSGSHDWAVSIRGFNDQFANKLLVLIDGRSVYTPLFSGVYWDAQDTLMEDIERIEVIRGPGATVWGANAVNGVINIITKNAKETTGNMVSLTGGNYDRGSVGVRHGLEIGDSSHLRVYAKNKKMDEFKFNSGAGAGDEWRHTQTGFRMDSELSENNTLNVQGDIYTSKQELTIFSPSLSPSPVATAPGYWHLKGGNIMANYSHAIDADSSYSAQVYLDNAQRNNPILKSDINTFDVELQYNSMLGENHQLNIGGGYRLVKSEFDNTFYYTQMPDERSDNLFSAFIQDKITLVPESVYLTLGSKFEHNDYTGFEYQPSARMSWLINENQTAWAAVSRAVRTPNLFTDDGQLVLQSFTTPTNGFVVTEGNQQLESEKMIAYEAGYRFKPVDTVYVDMSAFYNDYDDIFRGTMGATSFITTGTFAPYLAQYFPVYNDNKANSHGFEVATTWDVTDAWQLVGTYSFIDLDFDKTATGFTFEGKEPQQQFSIRSTALLTSELELNNALYYTDHLPGINVGDYYRFDTRLAWKPNDTMELSLVGQNLLDSSHPEFTGFVYQGNAEVPQTVYANIRLNF